MANNVPNVIFFNGTVYLLRRRLRKKIGKDIVVRKKYEKLETKVMNACSM